MGLWEFLTIIVVMGIISEMYKYGCRKKLQARAQDEAGRALDDALIARIEQLEKRMANLETIVIETEKHKEFDRLIK